MSRKFIVGGNWKMNGSFVSINKIMECLEQADLNENTEVFVAPPAPYLQYVRCKLSKRFGVAAQNCYKLQSGAFTGEISPNMIRDVNCEYVILGHSERRHVFGETDELIAEKIALALEVGLKVIACIGETAEERERGTTMEVVQKQTKTISAKITDWKNMILAYEPVWAIGTGKNATPQQVQDVHRDLRLWICKNIGKDVASCLRIQYGGSVNAQNAKSFTDCPDIDGFLVGGASLQPEFIDIINSRCGEPVKCCGQ